MADILDELDRKDAEAWARDRARRTAKQLQDGPLGLQRIYRALLDFHRDGVSEGVRLMAEACGCTCHELCDGHDEDCPTVVAERLIAKHEKGEG